MDSLRSIWNQMPMVRLLLPFMAGIGICIAVDHWFLVLLFLSVGVIVFTNLLKSAATVYRWRFVSGMAISIAMLASGYLVTYFNTERLDPHHIVVTNADGTFYKGVIIDPAVVKEKTVSALIEVREVGSGDSVRFVRGKVMASILRSEKSEALRYGDEILFTGKVKDYEAPKNPDQFDYRRYQALHHVYQRVFLAPGEWKVTRVGKGNAILTKIYQAREYYLSLIKREVTGANELAVATAIMLGYRDYVTDDVTQAYAGSGVLHVLSVSGLHVAVLYFVLNMLLGWMDKRRKMEIVKGVLVIIIMLFYAGLTGLSPPVLRSVWMFSLIVVARLLDRDVSMYNVLGVSCFILLLWDPFYIADVGFQLSYIAVAGIVYLYPLLSGLIENTDVLRTKISWLNYPVNWLMRWTWGLICVSIAAQIATFPISVFYFHSFPNYFLLSNLLVIPLSNFVLIAGMGLFMVGWSSTLVSWVGWVFDHLLIILNKVVFGIDAFPFALSKGVVVTSFEMVMLYVVIAMMCWYLADRRAKVLIASLCFLLLLCTAFSIHNIERQNKRELVVYSVKGKKAISFIDKQTAYYDFDSAMINDELLMRYNVRDHWYAAGVKKEVPIDSAKGVYVLTFGKVYEMGGKRVLVLDDGEGWRGRQTRTGKMKVDVVIISSGFYGDVKSVCDDVDFLKLVFDTSNRPKMLKKWIAECGELHVKYYDCGERAFVWEW
jgi:competence protein ComEC